MRRMKSPAAAAFLAVVLWSSLGVAGDSQSVEIKISGYAKPVCVLPSGSQAAGTNAQFANNNLLIDSLLDETTATVKASSARIVFPGVMCNYSAVVSLGTMHGGLISDGNTPDHTNGFLKKVDYVVTGSWGDVEFPTLNTATASPGAIVTTETVGANKGDLVVNFSTQNGNIPVLEGQFTDVLVLKVGAAL
jgi:hypothetical protein